MIVANLATYPPRFSHLESTVATIAAQVDRLNIVLNEYDRVPAVLSRFENVRPIIPNHDTKDAGKFYPETQGAKYVIFVDDDLLFPTDFVERTILNVELTGIENFFAGYHCSIYKRPSLRFKKQSVKDLARFIVSPNQIARFREMHHFGLQVEQPVYVDQIGTGAAIMSAENVPPYEFMKSSQKFVDVRMAKWCFERGIPRISLPRQIGWLNFEEVDQSILDSFTNKHHKYVADEIYSYAFKDPKVGQLV